MEHWTAFAWAYFALKNAETCIWWAAALTFALLAAMTLINIVEAPVDNPCFKKETIKTFDKVFAALAIVAIVLYTLVPSEKQMKILLGVEAASRIAHSDDAKRIAQKTISSFEKMVDELQDKE